MERGSTDAIGTDADSEDNLDHGPEGKPRVDTSRMDREDRDAFEPQALRRSARFLLDDLIAREYGDIRDVLPTDVGSQLARRMFREETELFASMAAPAFETIGNVVMALFPNRKKGRHDRDRLAVHGICKVCVRQQCQHPNEESHATCRDRQSRGERIVD